MVLVDWQVNLRKKVKKSKKRKSNEEEEEKKKLSVLCPKQLQGRRNCKKV
jgi:predicted transcriptional regulator